MIVIQQVCLAGDGIVVVIAGGAVALPDNFSGQPVTEIGLWAFQNSTNVTSVVLGSNVVAVGSQAFQDCTGLTNVILANRVASIGSYAFAGCTSLAGCTIPNSVTNIGDAAFQSCTKLTNIIVGTGVISLGVQAFSDCFNLATVYFKGNAPATNAYLFFWNTNLVYYLPGTTGWSSTFAGRPAVLWNPQMQTGKAVIGGVRTNRLVFTITGTTNIPVVLEACTNYSRPAWVTLQACTLTNGSVTFADTQWINYSSRFYRLRSP